MSEAIFSKMKIFHNIKDVEKIDFYFFRQENSKITKTNKFIQKLLGKYLKKIFLSQCFDQNFFLHFSKMKIFLNKSKNLETSNFLFFQSEK